MTYVSTGHLRRLLAALLLLELIVISAGCAAPVTTRRNIDEKLLAHEADNQRDVQLQTFFKRSKHLQEVAWPLLTANTDLCGTKVANRYGVFFGTQFDFPDDYQSSAQRVLGFDSNPRVSYTLERGPAREAGLQKGDILVSIDGTLIPQGKAATKKLMELMRQGPASITLTTRTDAGETKTTTLRGVPACDYPIILDQEDIVNAFADGKQVVITQGMYRFAESDTELSTVIGHELSHNIMGHMDKQTTNATGGLVLDVLAAVVGVNTQGAFSKAGAQMYSQDFESEADYVGLYLMARAGLKVDEAPQFWRRMAADHPGSIASNHSASHPATPERFLALQETVQEIDAKQAQNLALLPTLKEGASISNSNASGAIKAMTDKGSTAPTVSTQPAAASYSLQSGALFERARSMAVQGGCNSEVKFVRKDGNGAELYSADCITSSGAISCAKNGECSLAIQ